MPSRHLPAPPWIVAHRGARAEAPENTLESVELALDQGADMVEVDLQLSADGVPVACHDRSLGRVAGVELAVEEAPVALLRSLDVGRPWGRRARIPTLEEILAAVPETTPLNLEIKRRRANRPAICEALLAQVGGASRPILVSSFDWRLLELLRGLAPGLPLAPLSKRDGRALRSAGDRLGAWSLHAHRRLATAGLAAAARIARRPLLVFTVNAPDEARRLLASGVSGLFTDAPGRLRRGLEETV